MTPKKIQHNKWAVDLSIALSLIAVCEMCKQAEATDIAHRLKRDLIGWRFKSDMLEYFCAAKLCRKCHTSLDEAVGDNVHKIMFLKITGCIINRNWENIILMVGTVWATDLAQYIENNPWDPVLIYGKKKKELVGDGRINRGLKPMIKTFCDDCGQEIHGSLAKSHDFRDNVTVTNVQFTVSVELKPSSKSQVACVECSEKAFKHWLVMSSQAKGAK